MRQFVLLLLVAVLLLTGCSFKAEVLQPVPVESATPPPVTPAEPTITASVPVFTGAPVPGFTPSPTETLFYDAYAVSDAAQTVGRSSFASGTKRIYVKWTYQNMREGMMVRREWFLDDQLWLEREEAWDFAKYGASGVVTDVSIYDFEAGLPVGQFKLAMYIDGVVQPIGRDIPEARASGFFEFEIVPAVEAISPNGAWTATSLLDRLTLTDAGGTVSDLVTGQEIISMTWLDDQHLVYVDRDRTGQVARPLVGVRDSLWIVDILSRGKSLLYAGDDPLGSTGGLYPSPDGKFIAAILGSGFGDACFLDSKVFFLEMAGDYQSARPIQQDQFAGFPALTDGSLYPPAVGTWMSETKYLSPMNQICGTGQTLSGTYLFDLAKSSVSRLPDGPTTQLPGDLGWGEIHGVVTDAVTGKPVAGALVTCEHNSYTTAVNLRCAGGISTGADGRFVYEKIFFHDTDTIRLTVTAPGYESQSVTQSSFNVSDLTANFSLKPSP